MQQELQKNGGENSNNLLEKVLAEVIRKKGTFFVHERI
jgi:hypothetical protein